MNTTTMTSLALVGATLCMVATPAAAHHSYAMYDPEKVVTVTGVTVSFLPQSAHAELRMYLLGPDGKLLKRNGQNVEYGIEMAAAAAIAQQGVTAAAFPVGTIFSVRVNPMRNGDDFGARVSTIAKCPWKTTPKPGQTCAQVPGAQMIGGASF